MTDEADRPLTRRERRLREIEETGGVPPVVETAAPEDSASEAGVEEIEISPFNDDGTPRSRREIRELRARALAARGEVAPPEPDGGLDPQLEETQPFTLADLEEIAEDRAAAPAQTGEPVPVGDVGPDASASEDEPGFAADDDADDDAEDASGRSEAGDRDDADADPGYRFPDIAPLDESVSVFDDPAVRTARVPAEGGAAGGDFDDLISRAVAQEGATGTTNSSALILPNLPDTGELSGRIGETGELFITGSIELPRSLGETGSHAPIHDADPLDELGFGELETSDGGISPVAAKRAVSAVSAGDAIVAQETREKSKLPLVLILTGGGLVIAVGALIIWGASAGMFG